MAASTKSHAEGLEIEIIVGSYEQVLFGYMLTESNDAATLNLSFTDKTHCGSIRSLAVSSNNLLASGSTDETIQLFDLKSRHEAGTLMKHSGTITNLEFYDEFMISSDDDGIICIWKIRGKSYECMKTLSGHKGAVLSMAVHPSGKMLLSVGHDKTLRTWNLVTAKRAYTTNTASMVDIIRWSPDGEKYILCYNGKLDVCLVAKAAPTHSVKLPGKGHSLEFVTDKILVIGCEGGALVFLNIDTGVLIHEYKVTCNRIKCVSVKKLERRKSLLALITNDGVIELLLVTSKDDKVSTSLIAATKTVLRPICMQLVTSSSGNDFEANGNEADGSPVSTEKSEAVADITDESVRVSRMKRKKASVDTERASTATKRDVSDPELSKSSKKKKSKRTEDKPEQEMDKIKKVFTSKSKGEKTAGDVETKHKKHIKPVDSVKITKQKFSDQKKRHAKHHDHHITEETEST